MMIESTFINPVAGFFVVLSLCILFLGIRIYRLDKNYKSVVTKCDTLQSHITAMCSAAVNIGKNIDQLDKKVDALTERQEKYELNESQEQTMNYGQAKVLLNRGANVEDVVENCGVTYGEAELIAMMSKLEAQQSRHL